MHCPRCGTLNDDSHRYCGKCGLPMAADVQAHCPTCRAKTPAMSSYCVACGAALAPATSVPAPVTPPEPDTPRPDTLPTSTLLKREWLWTERYAMLPSFLLIGAAALDVIHYLVYWLMYDLPVIRGFSWMYAQGTPFLAHLGSSYLLFWNWLRFVLVHTVPQSFRLPLFVWGPFLLYWVLAVAGTILSVQLFAGLWQAIRGRHARATLGRAILPLFLPLFNVIWSVRKCGELTVDYNSYLERHGLPARRSSGALFYSLPALFWATAALAVPVSAQSSALQLGTVSLGVFRFIEFVTLACGLATCIVWSVVLARLRSAVDAARAAARTERSRSGTPLSEKG